MALVSPEEYCQLAGSSGLSSEPGVDHGYSALPSKLLAAEQSVIQRDPAVAAILNKALCRTLLEQFPVANVPWNLPERFKSLYQQQISRIERQLSLEPESYFSLNNDPFRKDLAILRHRLIPFGAELATPYSGVARSLFFKGGVGQAGRFIRVIATCRGVKPFLELHMHPRSIEAFNPDGWIETYENLADFLAANPSFRGVQSTSWFLDPALEHISPHLGYLRRVPEQCGATILYAGDEDGKHSGAFATSQTRRDLYAAGQYRPRRYTRIWPRQKLLLRRWRSL